MNDPMFELSDDRRRGERQDIRDAIKALTEGLGRAGRCCRCDRAKATTVIDVRGRARTLCHSCAETWREMTWSERRLAAVDFVVRGR